MALSRFRLCSTLCVLAVYVSLTWSFVPETRKPFGRCGPSKLMVYSNNNRDRSRLEGNQRSPTPEELQVMDEMIDKLANAPPYELPNAVRRAFRVLSSPQFFLRIAHLADKATTGEGKEKLSTLASNLVSTLEVVVETTEEKLDERAKVVEDIVKEAAEPDTGEFLVPLTPGRINAMRKKLENIDEGSLDEGFLGTLDAWMNKSHQDGMDGMVVILQKVLQIYAGTQIARSLLREGASPGNSAACEDMLKLLRTNAEGWDTEIASINDKGAVQQEVQRVMESIVLQLEAGSMTQRIQAEFLNELVKRIETTAQQRK